MKRLLTCLAAVLLMATAASAQLAHGSLEIQTAAKFYFVRMTQYDHNICGPVVSFRDYLPLKDKPNMAVVLGIGGGIFYPLTAPNETDKTITATVGFDMGWKPVRLMPYLNFGFYFSPEETMNYSSFGLEAKFRLCDILYLSTGADFRYSLSCIVEKQPVDLGMHIGLLLRPVIKKKNKTPTEEL